MSGITGIDRLYKAAGVLRERVDEELSKELEDTARKAIDPFNRAVFDRIETDLPKSGGYADLFAASFRVIPRITAQGGGLRIRLQGTAHGRAKKRDAAALNRGVLRHKTYGRATTESGKSLWFSQAIRPGFWDEPAKKLVTDLRGKLAEVVEKVARKIEAQL